MVCECMMQHVCRHVGMAATRSKAGSWYACDTCLCLPGDVILASIGHKHMVGFKACYPCKKLADLFLK
jgi:hypothetical protein